jgi:F420-non-reducing hydrogenase iron-sulfur subunit
MSDPKVVGFVCDWSVDLTTLLDGVRLRELPSVRIVRIPCSGFVRPGWLEDALRSGADGVFVLGCPYGDCLNREGNYLMRDRVDQLQRRLQRRRVDPNRMAMLAHGLHDRAAFLGEVRAFIERLRTLAAPAPNAPAKAPAAAGAEGEAR